MTSFSCGEDTTFVLVAILVNAPVAQWIEHSPRKVWSRVRFLPGANFLTFPYKIGNLPSPYERRVLSRVNTREEYSKPE
jgi:hypothetical protein